MRLWLALIATAALLPALTSCVTTSETVGQTAIAALSPYGQSLPPGLTVLVEEHEVIALTVPADPDAQVVDYILERTDSDDRLHLESAAPQKAFLIEVPRLRLYAGTYRMRAYVDKAAEPLEHTFTVTDAAW